MDSRDRDHGSRLVTADTKTHHNACLVLALRGALDCVDVTVHPAVLLNLIRELRPEGTQEFMSPFEVRGGVAHYERAADGAPVRLLADPVLTFCVMHRANLTVYEDGVEVFHQRVDGARRTVGINLLRMMHWVSRDVVEDTSRDEALARALAGTPLAPPAPVRRPTCLPLAETSNDEAIAHALAACNVY